MNYFSNPKWVSQQLLEQVSLDDIPQPFFDKINDGLLRLSQNRPPVVSIVIPMWNEELNIIQTLWSISQNVTTYPTEIIAINNNSTDRTQESLDRLAVKSFLQKIQGCGPARQLGQEVASGKYILTADADCFYPKEWIQTMADELNNDKVSCVYGRHSFIARSKWQRVEFFIYESLRDLLIELRHSKRPYLNALGMTMGYRKAYGIEVGFDQRNVRGEDGRLCFDLMKFGEIVKTPRSLRVWTMPRTIGREKNMAFSLSRRILVELSRVHEFFYKKNPHNTHTSENYKPSIFDWFKKGGEN